MTAIDFRAFDIFTAGGFRVRLTITLWSTTLALIGLQRGLNAFYDLQVEWIFVAIQMSVSNGTAKPVGVAYRD